MNSLETIKNLENGLSDVCDFLACSLKTFKTHDLAKNHIFFSYGLVDPNQTLTGTIAISSEFINILMNKISYRFLC